MQMSFDVLTTGRAGADVHPLRTAEALAGAVSSGKYSGGSPNSSSYRTSD